MHKRLVLPGAPRGTIRVRSIDAAREHLNTALVLWFADKEPVSVHTLAYAAFEVINDMNKRAKKPPLLYEHLPEYNRNELISMLREHAYFFKHADGRKQAQAREFILFLPRHSELFMVAALEGLWQLDVPFNETEKAFRLWFAVHRPQFHAADFIERLRQSLPIEAWRGLKRYSKKQFLQAMVKTARRLKRRVRTS